VHVSRVTCHVSRVITHVCRPACRARLRAGTARVGRRRERLLMRALGWPATAEDEEAHVLQRDEDEVGQLPRICRSRGS
jgi:hypothetical protein